MSNAKQNDAALVALFLLVAASPVFAQGTGSGVGTGELKFVGAALGMGIASGLCGLGQGKAVSGAAEAVARNPGARAGIQTLLVLGLAFIEIAGHLHAVDHLR